MCIRDRKWLKNQKGNLLQPLRIMTNIVLRGEELSLLPEKAIYWPKEQLLLIADLHLGKVEHFRKAGIAVPAEAGEANYHVLQELILEHSPKRVIFLGDLFHSNYNYDWELFRDFLESHDNVSFELIKGNHDILHKSQYDRVDMICLLYTSDAADE